MSERLSRSPELTEQEPKDGQILSGEQLLRSISNLPPEHHFSAEQKFLFSTISDMSDQTNFPISPNTHENAIFTSFGLEYKNRRYPFTKQYQTLAHHAALSSIAQEVNSQEEFVTHLESKNEDWCKLLKESYEKQARLVATERFHSAMNSKRLEAQKYSRARSLWDSYEKGPLNKAIIEEIISKAKKYYRNCSPEGRTIESAKEFVESRGFDAFSKKAKELKDRYPGYVDARNNLKRKLDGYTIKITDILDDYLDSIGLNEARSFKKQTDGHSQHIYKTIINKVKNREKDMPLEEAKGLLYNRLFLDFDASEDEKGDLQKVIDKVTTKAINYYGTIIPELSSYDEKPREFYEKELYRVRSEMQQLLHSKRSIIDNMSERITSSYIDTFKNRIAEIVFPNAKTEDIYLLPTGVVIKDSNNNLFSKDFSPLSEHILALFTDEATEAAWRIGWAKHAHDYDVPVRAFLKKNLKQNALNNTDSLDGKLSELSERFQVSYPESISIETGRIAESLQPNDYELLKSILPTISGFVNEISLLPPERDINLKSTRLEVISFLSGESELKNSQLFGDGRKLKLRALEALLLSAGPEKREKVAARLIPELGISVFYSLSTDARSKFSQLVGANANVSRTEFYRIYRRSVPDPKLRRSLAERTFFINEFQKYLKGTSTMSEYFDSIKKKPAISDNKNLTRD